MKTETVCFGDCLAHLKQWIRWNRGLTDLPPSLADLIYLDPPWNSKANYNIIFGAGQADNSATAQETAFTDMWQWNPEAERRVNRICGTIYHEDYCDHAARKSMLGLKMFIGKTGMLAYCAYMAERLALLHTILKDTGSIYLHCDPHASHYLKMIMDDIFGHKNFRNEIVWCYEKPRPSKYKWRANHDCILFYVKGEENTFNAQRVPTLEGKFEMRKPFKRPDGTIWKPKEPGKTACDWWYDIPSFATRMTAKERTGYPTQKPLKLLKRIIKASTNEGDVVLDPFCGCGTAVVAAHQLKRKFVGVDISLFAIETVAYNRLQNEAKMLEKDIKVMGIPADFPSAKRLAKDDPFAFEIFAVEACIPGMVANKVQRGDKGIDGKGWLLHPVKEKGKEKWLILAQVKAGKPTLSQVRDFANVIRDDEDAVDGVFITVEKIGKEGDGTAGMREVAYRQGTFQHEHSIEEFPRLQFWHIERFFNKTPHLRLPNLPELADPYKKEKVPIKQIGFLMKRYGK